MLNARTSVDRYGPEPGFTDVKSLTPTKQPVKLPEAERSARLQQLYERTSKWRQRCEERYAKERREKTTSELEDCTFSPKISTASHLITQVCGMRGIRCDLRHCGAWYMSSFLMK